MIYITGDCHGNFERFNASIFPEQNEMTKEDYVIICGDFGGALDPTEKYVIDLEEELEFQSAIIMSFQIMGPPPALKNYHAWLFENGFNVELPNPTNEVVASYYGVKPL